MESWGDALAWAANIPPEGGRIELPDGTIIEVRREVDPIRTYTHTEAAQQNAAQFVTLHDHQIAMHELESELAHYKHGPEALEEMGRLKHLAAEATSMKTQALERAERAENALTAQDEISTIHRTRADKFKEALRELLVAENDLRTAPSVAAKSRAEEARAAASKLFLG